MPNALTIALLLILAFVLYAIHDTMKHFYTRETK